LQVQQRTFTFEIATSLEQQSLVAKLGEAHGLEKGLGIYEVA